MFSMVKRWFLFLLVNILVMSVISAIWAVVANYFGLEMHGYAGLFFMCLVFGMGSSIVSLFLSKFMAKRAYNIQLIDPKANNSAELQHLVLQVHQLAQKAGISKMPEVGVYESNELNAFATGPTKNSALVAVSSGLLHKMDQDELEGVLGHEIAHIANGDMVTMTLIQGVINVVVMFLARIIANLVISQISRDNDRQGGGSPFLYFIIVAVLQVILSLFGSIVVNAFSRYREYRADYGGAKYAGRAKMIKALQKLKSTYQPEQKNTEKDPALAALKISGKQKKSFMALFATHPDLDDRIEKLKYLQML